MKKKQNDLVGCICLTYINIDLFENSVVQFSKQTYKNKVLIVVDNSPMTIKTYSNAVDDIIAKYNVNAVHIKEKSGKTTGYYRQVGLVKAYELGCRYFATWDDDDVFSTNRLEYQVREMTKKGALMCLFGNFTIEIRRNKKDSLFFNCFNDGGHCPSMVVDLNFENEMEYGQRIAFENRKIAEDVRYIEDFKSRYGEDRYLVLDNPFSDYIYIGHGNNITGSKHFVSMVKKCKVD